MEVPSVDAYSTVHLRLQFYTSQHKGLLFLAAGQADYLLMELQSGILQVRKALFFLQQGYQASWPHLDLDKAGFVPRRSQGEPAYSQAGFGAQCEAQ